MNNYILIGFIFITGCKTISRIESPILEHPNNNESFFLKPLTIDYESSIIYGSKKISVNGIIKTNANNDIYINGYSSSFGIEIFRLILKKDSVFLIDKLNKKYFKGSEAEFEALNIPSFHQFKLVNVLFGNTIFDTIDYTIDSSYFINDFSIKTYKSKNSFMSSYGKVTLYYSYLIKNQQFSDKNTNIMINYDEYFHKRNVPRKIFIEGSLNNFALDIFIKYKNVSKGKDESFNLTVPKNYSLFQ
ncbi:MAG: DUF4292 domain-containing protein [Salinivirgaceae bacterium]